VARFDGRHINQDIAMFAAGKWVATGEALAMHVWERLVDQLPKGVTLDCVRIEESSHHYSEYRGET
jgi:6-pyruvoyl-tetrahydropterin synthase